MKKKLWLSAALLCILALLTMFIVMVSKPVKPFLVLLLLTYTVAVIVLIRIIRRIRDKNVQRDLTMIISSLLWPVCIVNPADHCIVYANDVFKDLFGRPAGVFRNSFWDIFPEYQPNGRTSRECLAHLFGAGLDTEGVPIEEMTGRGKNGEIITLKGSAAEMVFHNGKVIAVILQDVSLEKRNEEILKSTAKKEREANQLKSKFIIKMSHEIRTPMNAIIGLTQIELLKQHHPDVSAVFHKIDHAATILLSIINDILDFSAIEAQEFKIKREKFNFEKLISRILFSSSQKLMDKKVEMLLHVHHDIPRYIYTDKNIVSQILKNILDNAVQFTDFGTIILSLHIGEEDDSHMLILCVEDTGCGMAKEELEKIFIPFEQFGESEIRASGTGLGMPIIKKLAEQLGGAVRIESELKAGTRVMVRIPLQAEDPSKKIIGESYCNSLAGKKILIVDDCRISCQIMEELLHYAGAETRILETAEAVLPHMKEVYGQGGSYDIVLLDYLLDKGTGMEIGRNIRRQISDSVKLLMVSAYVKFQLDVFDKENIFDDRIDKPFTPSEFYAKLCNAVNGIGGKTKEEIQLYHFPKARVLVCEDNFINQEVIKGMLEYYSIKPVIVNNGREGIEALKARTFDLVIMDILMPVMDGHAATAAIRNAKEDYHEVPIIAMTANALSEEREECRKEGMNGYITKPVDLAVLYQELLIWLKGEKKPQESRAETDEGEQDLPDDRLIRLTELGVDVNMGIERFGGKASVYQKTLERFFRDTLKEGMLPADRLESENQTEREEFKRYIHNMKGVTGNLSLRHTHTMLKKFEDTLKFGKPDLQLYHQIESTLTERCKKALAILEKNRDTALEQGSSEECMGLLQELKEYLVQGKAKECEELIILLEQKSWQAFAKDEIAAICKAVDDYDYQTAVDRIDLNIERFDRQT